MKHILLSTLFAVFGLVSVFAQTTFTVNMQNPVQTGLSSDAFIKATSTVTNNTGADLTLRWRKSVENLPSGWTASVCDKNTCWLPTEQFKDFTLSAGETADMSVQFEANGVDGIGDVTLRIFDPANPTEEYFNKYTADADPNSIFGADEVVPVSVFPNPASMYFMLDGDFEIDEIQMVNVIGKVVKVFNATSATQFDISDQTSGSYFLRFVYQGELIGTQRLVVRLP